MKDLRLAVLIDADNIPSSPIKEMLEEISKDGTPTIKRIYGDWTKPTHKGWKDVLLEHAITPIQQYGYTTGKNATDSALIIDAMDILYAGKVDGFCIVSSDSDFTRLATRLRETGMVVIGIGEKKTPQPFITACNKFVYIEILRQTLNTTKLTNKQSKDNIEVKTLNKVDQELINLLVDSVNDIADESGWTSLGALGSFMLKKKADFDSRNYGYRKLGALIKSTGRFTLEERETGNAKHSWVKIK